MPHFTRNPVAVVPRWVLAIACAVFLAFTTGACGKTSTGAVAPERLVVTGSSTIAPLVAEIAKRYEAENPGLRIDVQTGGSSRGLLDTRKGLAEIGMVSRALREEEADVDAHLLARDGVGIIVHADNPLTTIDNAEVVDIYTGKTTSWSALAGHDETITVVHKAAGRSTHEVFVSHFGLAPEEIRASVVIGDNEQGIKSVASNRGAVGYVSIGAAEVSVRAGVPIKLLTLSGVEASTATVADGSYPLSRELNLITMNGDARLPTAAEDFLRYALSDRVNDLIGSQSFVAVD